jgi:hypothetical protein
MALLDQFFRSATVAILATMTVVFARNVRRIPSAASSIAFFATIAAHLVLTSPDYAGVRALDLILPSRWVPAKYAGRRHWHRAVLRSLTLVALALARVIRGFPSDLVEHRGSSRNPPHRVWIADSGK